MHIEYAVLNYIIFLCAIMENIDATVLYYSKVTDY